MIFRVYSVQFYVSFGFDDGNPGCCVQLKYRGKKSAYYSVQFTMRRDIFAREFRSLKSLHLHEVEPIKRRGASREPENTHSSAGQRIDHCIVHQVAKFELLIFSFSFSRYKMQLVES